MRSIFKAHGLGNDYLALDGAALPFGLTPPAVRALCDRHTGVGSDGVLLRVEPDAAEFGVRIFNPDGTEAEKSGNGLRVFAAFLHDLGEVGKGTQFGVETLGGLVRMEILDETPTGLLVEAEMGRASFRSADVGMRGPDREVDGEPLELAAGDRVTISAVSMGNPHCVVFEDELDPDDLRRRAPGICTHPEFTRGTNVQFARATGPAELEAWVWERGAGETRASGSSACAVAAAAVRRGLVSERRVTVRMPGGALDVEVGTEWAVVLRAPVESTLRAQLTSQMIHRLQQLS